MSSQRFPPPAGVFGRAWHIAIDGQRASDPTGSLIIANSAPRLEDAIPHYVVSSRVAADETPLHVVFAIDTAMSVAYWTAELTIFNLARTTRSVGTGAAENLSADSPLLYGDTVSISAGYEQGVHIGPSGNSADPFDPQLNFLYAGRVFQPIWTRVNVVDYTLKLRLAFGFMEDSLNFLSLPISKGATYYDTLDTIAKESGAKLDVAPDAEKKLRDITFPRAQAVHDRPFQMVRELMRQSTLFAWVGNPTASGDPPNIHVRSFTGKEEPTTVDINYGPPGFPTYTWAGKGGLGSQGLIKPTLIGVPQQTFNGVTFRVLMDPDVRIGMVIQLAPGTIINPYEYTFMQQRPARPSRNGMYSVSGLRHYGDSRGHGDDWFTEITALLWDWFPKYQDAMTAYVKEGARKDIK
jgi:hypothetical protein